MKATDRFGRLARRLVLALAVLLAGVHARPAAAQPPARLVITDVNVVGNHRIATGQVMALLKTRPGADYSLATVEEDVRRLTESRWFANANNAALGTQAAYDDQVGAFERLFVVEGSDFDRFYAEVKRIAALPRPERDAAMARYRVEPEPAPVVAPATPASGVPVSG